MRSLFFFISFCIALGCSKKNNQRIIDLNSNFNFESLLGQWQRENNSGEKRTFENWTKTNKGSYIGHGFTLLNADTVFQERMEVISQNGSDYLKISGPNEEPINFKITRSTASSFTCENLQNEFPKYISYRTNGNKIQALISDGENEIAFIFSKM